MTSLTFIEGFMPIQAIVEVAGCLLLFGAFNYLLNKSGLGLSKFWSAVGVWVFIQLYLTYRIYPPLPFSIRAVYGIVTLCAVFMWVSGSKVEWEAFRRPVLNVLDGVTKFHQGIRLLVVVVLPLACWGGTFWYLFPIFEEPVELRTPIPALPAATVVHGQTFVLQRARNPYRVNLQGQYDPEYSIRFLADRDNSGLMRDVNDPEANPWNPDAKGYMKAVREGGILYFENCHFCHGAELNGLGMLGYAVRPYPFNFKGLRGIMRRADSSRFFHVAQGGLGLPGEAFPWSSSMPPFKEHLTIDEIWKVVLFVFWHTGEPPFFWDEK